MLFSQITSPQITERERELLVKHDFNTRFSYEFSHFPTFKKIVNKKYDKRILSSIRFGICLILMILGGKIW